MWIDNLSIFLGVGGVLTVGRKHLLHLVEDAGISELNTGILSSDESGDLRLLLDLIEFELGSLTLQRKRLIARTLLLSADYLGMTAYVIDEQSAQGAGDAQRATPSAGVYELFAHAHLDAIVHTWPRTLARMCGRALRPTT